MEKRHCDLYRTECLQRGVKYLQIAVENDNKKQYQLALDNYILAIDFVLTGMRYTTQLHQKNKLRNKLDEFLRRAEVLKVFLREQEKVKDQQHAKRKLEGVSQNNNNALSALETTVSESVPKMTWNDVAGLEFAKRQLEEAIILPNKFPQLFTGKRQPWKGILLYGPPGTGKTHLAKAIASVSGAKFFSVSASDLISKYVGESEKNLKELFHKAMSNKPAIIFLDEVDSICSTRKEGEHDATQRFKSEFLVRMNEIANTQGVLVLGATNRPFDLDPAIRRRFEKRIYIPLPDKKARESLFTIHVGDETVKIGKNTFQKLAQATEGYSGSDISNIIREALFLPLRQAMNATHWKKVKSTDPSIPYMMRPCSPRDPDAIEIKMMHLEPETVLLPEITEEIFFESLKSIKPTVNKEELETFQKFTEMYGSMDTRQNTVVEEKSENRNRVYHERESQGTRGQSPKCAVPMM